MIKKLLPVLAAVAVLCGCAGINKNPFTAERIADHAAYDVALVVLEKHPEWRPQFQKAHDDLFALENTPTFDTLAVIEIIQRLPAKELKGTTAQIIIDGAVLIVELTGNPALKPKDQEALRVVVKGLREGLERRLSEA